MELNLEFELDLVWSRRKKLKKFISKKYLYQLEKIYQSFKESYFDQIYDFRREIPSGERRFFPTSSKNNLLYKFININGFILITIDGEEEKYFVDNLNQFSDIEIYLYQYIFYAHPKKLKKFDRKKNIKVKINLEGTKRPFLFEMRRLSV